MLDALSPHEILNYYNLSKRPSSPVLIRPNTSVILYRAMDTVDELPKQKKIGLILVLVAAGGLLAATFPYIKLETTYQLNRFAIKLESKFFKINPRPRPNQVVIPITQIDPFPLVDNKGFPIEPADKNFSLIIPKIGVNAPIIPGVNPSAKTGYLAALKKGVAHASTSYYPSDNGTVYLFSHSTNYEWFIKDLNAVFYHLKNLAPEDMVVIVYLGDRYTYKIRETKIVSRREVAYLVPQKDTRNLILQTCWPPGTADKRLLIFADLVDERNRGQFKDQIYKTPS